MFGQMSIKGMSEQADYLQLNICGLNAKSAIEKYDYFKRLRGEDIPVVLHGDWTNKGCSENNIKGRYKEYILIAKALGGMTDVKGITIHPPYRKKVAFNEFIDICEEIERNGINVFIENRSNNKIWLSEPKEVIDFSKCHSMTIDIPQLYISCGFSNDCLNDTLSNLDWSNVKEIHLANLKRSERGTHVARKLNDGEIDIQSVMKYLTVDKLITLEILGGVPTFDNQIVHIKNRA